MSLPVGLLTLWRAVPHIAASRTGLKLGLVVVYQLHLLAALARTHFQLRNRLESLVVIHVGLRYSSGTEERGWKLGPEYLLVIWVARKILVQDFEVLVPHGVGLRSLLLEIGTDYVHGYFIPATLDTPFHVIRVLKVLGNFFRSRNLTFTEQLYAKKVVSNGLCMHAKKN